ncbi:hypothetical protein EV126DRAFT_15588 [Verticillium dahliae]|nr:hypothetical protein EV126DRAFT_15588 [Verticillium dahliae]
MTLTSAWARLTLISTLVYVHGATARPHSAAVLCLSEALAIVHTRLLQIHVSPITTPSIFSTHSCARSQFGHLKLTDRGCLDPYPPFPLRLPPPSSHRPPPHRCPLFASTAHVLDTPTPRAPPPLAPARNDATGTRQVQLHTHATHLCLTSHLAPGTHPQVVQLPFLAFFLRPLRLLCRHRTTRTPSSSYRCPVMRSASPSPQPPTVL